MARGIGEADMKSNFSPLSFQGLRSLALIAIAFAVVETRPSIGAEQATGVLLYEQGSAGVFQYNIDVKDSGTTNIGTLWYGWVPGEDFLGTSPTNLEAPSGWSVQVTNLGANDGFAVQWINHSGPLTPGQTLSGFGFNTTQAPTVLAGTSPFHSDVPVSTTFIYIGAPLTDAGFEFNINPTAHLWQNPFAQLDVNNDGMVSAADVLLEVNALRTSGIHSLGVPTVGETLPRFVDTNGDGLLSPIDLLLVVGQLTVQSPTASDLGMSEHPSAITMHIVPEPSSAALLFLGSAILAVVGHRRRASFSDLRA